MLSGGVADSERNGRMPRLHLHCGRAAARATSAIVSNPVRGPTEDSFEQWIVVKKTRFDGRQ